MQAGLFLHLLFFPFFFFLLLLLFPTPLDRFHRVFVHTHQSDGDKACVLKAPSVTPALLASQSAICRQSSKQI